MRMLSLFSVGILSMVIVMAILVEMITKPRLAF